MDLSLLTRNDISFGGRIGHASLLRYNAEKALKVEIDEFAYKTDAEIEELYIKEGFVPVVIKGHEDSMETIFLVKKEILENSIQLTR